VYQDLLLAWLRTGEVAVDEPDGLQQVRWRIWQTASEVDLAREVSVRQKLKLGNVKVFSHLIHLGVHQEEDGCIFGVQGQVAACVAVPQQRNDSCSRGSLDASLEAALVTTLELVVQKRALVDQSIRTDAFRDVVDPAVRQNSLQYRIVVAVIAA